MTIDIFMQNYFARLWILNDDMQRTFRIIDIAGTDPTRRWIVDPLDGTREFVEGRLEAVTSLVGIAVGGRARPECHGQ